MKINKILLLGLIIALVVIISGCGTPIPKDMDKFANCLNENGAIMYGAYWCSHCNEQKAMFGNSTKKLNYVECTEDEQKCSAAGIQGYPTWKFADGSSLPGKQEFLTLAKKTGCPLS
jgi:hypothetical protein